MGERRIITIWLTGITLAGELLFMLFYLIGEYGKDSIGMDKIIANYGTLITTIVTLAGMFGVFAAQLIFYKKDSQTMSEIKSGVSRGGERLHDQVDHKQEVLSGEHKGLSRQNAEVRDIVMEIRLNQAQELKLQEKIRDTVPDAGMLKDGIEKICWENAQMKNEIIELRHEIQQLQEKNREMSQEIRQNRRQSRGMER